MNPITFDEDHTYLPMTMQQFEDLTNEMLVKINTLLTPNALDADYTAQILMSAIHSLDHKYGIASKKELFENCINRVSCHITYHAVQEIQRRLKEKAEQEDKGQTKEAMNGKTPHLKPVPAAQDAIETDDSDSPSPEAMN